MSKEQDELRELYKLSNTNVFEDFEHDMAVRDEHIKKEAFTQGQRVGQYQAADKLYSHITTMWTFRDGSAPELSLPDLATDILKDCEKLLNHNRKVYVGYVSQLPQNEEQSCACTPKEKCIQHLAESLQR